MHDIRIVVSYAAKDVDEAIAAVCSELGYSIKHVQQMTEVFAVVKKATLASGTNPNRNPIRTSRMYFVDRELSFLLV